MTGTTRIDRYYNPGEPKAFGAVQEGFAVVS